MSEVPLQVGLDARPGHEGALLSSVLTPLVCNTPAIRGYRGTSPTRKLTPLEPYLRPMPRVLEGS